MFHVTWSDGHQQTVHAHPDGVPRDEVAQISTVSRVGASLRVEMDRVVKISLTCRKIKENVLIL